MSDEGGARFSLPVGEGSGAILGMAAADAASGVTDGAYSAVTQQAGVVAYHLFRHGRIDRAALAEELSELDGDDHEPSVYRDLSPDMSKWLESSRAGEGELASASSLDPAVRVVPLGVWYRRSPEELIQAVLDAARVTHLDGPSAVMAAAVAGAVAGGCFAQNGRDLLMAVLEVAADTRSRIVPDRYANSGQVADLIDRLAEAKELTGADPETIVGRLGDDTLGRGCTALVLAAPVSRDPVATITTAARVAGSHGAAVVGAIIGARIGPRRWPWAFPNDTWFVAIGERLVEGRVDLADLPVPYAVEQRVSYSTPHRAL